MQKPFLEEKKIVLYVFIDQKKLKIKELSITLQNVF